MSYTIDLIVSDLPSSNDEVWKAIEALRAVYYEDKREKSPKLLQLHEVLTEKYPCLSSYEDDEDDDECPWADGPMLNNFAHEMGMLAISFSRADEVVPYVVQKANALGIVVADGQSGKVYRPQQAASVQATPQPTSTKAWWKFWQ
ncbi:hypothetical protein [Viridibacterium curvum]|uniref:Uncharacterized protein n=1 Tax=Viridibacterium curvum TaxID=1101404 RepID=A0ABP9R8Q8_9RHOO